MAGNSQGAAAPFTLAVPIDAESELALLRDGVRTMRFLAEAGEAYLQVYAGCEIEREEMVIMFEAIIHAANQATGRDDYA